MEGSDFGSKCGGLFGISKCKHCVQLRIGAMAQDRFPVAPWTIPSGLGNRVPRHHCAPAVNGRYGEMRTPEAKWRATRTTSKSRSTAVPRVVQRQSPMEVLGNVHTGELIDHQRREWCQKGNVQSMNDIPRPFRTRSIDRRRLPLGLPGMGQHHQLIQLQCSIMNNGGNLLGNGRRLSHPSRGNDEKKKKLNRAPA